MKTTTEQPHNKYQTTKSTNTEIKGDIDIKF